MSGLLIGHLCPWLAAALRQAHGSRMATSPSAGNLTRMFLEKLRSLLTLPVAHAQLGWLPDRCLRVVQRLCSRQCTGRRRTAGCRDWRTGCQTTRRASSRSWPASLSWSCWPRSSRRSPWPSSVRSAFRSIFIRFVSHTLVSC